MKSLYILLLLALVTVGCNETKQPASEPAVSQASQTKQAQLTSGQNVPAPSEKEKPEITEKQKAEFEKRQKEIEEKNKIDAEASAKLAAEEKAKAALREKFDIFEVSGTKFESDQYGFRYVIGTLKNTTSSELKYVSININLYDDEKNQVGSTLAAVQTLDANGTWKFKAPVTEKSAKTFKIKDVKHLNVK
ncbi:FxLYD domain-containing protein [Paenibacillus elgii]